jgi:hypothetical protein
MLKQVVFVFTTAFSIFINKMLGAGIGIGRFVSKIQEICSPQSVSCSFTSHILATNFIQLWTAKEGGSQNFLFQNCFMCVFNTVLEIYSV